MTPTQPPAREAEETPEAQLTELHMDERGLEFRMKHPIVPIMAEHLAEAFKAAGGVNYVAFDVNCEDIGPLVLTMQRRLGETPEMQVRRMRATLATTQAERDALAAEVAALRTPVTDEALVEVAAQAGCETAGLCEPAYEWEHAIKERKAAWRIIARAVLAAVGPALAAAERRKFNTLVAAFRVNMLRARPETTHAEIDALVDVIRTGAPDAR